jgi:hypothetical protein
LATQCNVSYWYRTKIQTAAKATPCTDPNMFDHFLRCRPRW